MNMHNSDFLLDDLTKLKGVGKKTSEILKKKKLIKYSIFYSIFHIHTLTEPTN
tara:strand:- start:534 stop:692 length:159 start_codon:yes stop_codon:yes gene_type:complete